MSDINYILSTLSERQQIAQTVSNSQSEKLATIEEGATADQTADEIRALSIHSVMGESSRADGATQYAAGLVLEGNSTHGNEFLRKDGTWAAAGSSIIEPFNASSATSLPFNSQTYSLVEIEQPIQTVILTSNKVMHKGNNAGTWLALYEYNLTNGAAMNTSTSIMKQTINLRSTNSKVRLQASISSRIDKVSLGLKFVRDPDGSGTELTNTKIFGRSTGNPDDDPFTYVLNGIDEPNVAGAVTYEIQVAWLHPTSSTGYAEINWHLVFPVGTAATQTNNENTATMILTELHPVCAIVRN